MPTVTGVLKGFDQLLNLVLDDVVEQLQTGTYSLIICFGRSSHPSADGEPATRSLGLVVLRGPTITLLSPVDGFEEIANPFLAQEA